MKNLAAYSDLPLRGGFLLRSLRYNNVSMADALGRPAVARTTIVGITLEIELDAHLSAEEISISLYHEVLEAAAVAASTPPKAVCELNEAGLNRRPGGCILNLGQPLQPPSTGCWSFSVF